MSASAVPAQAKRLLDFIASKEAPHGYDTVYGNNQVRMPKRLTSMTVAQVISDGPRRTRAYGSSACGRYQFMTETLKGLIAGRPEWGAMMFTPDIQDTMGYALLIRRGYPRFMSGAISTEVFGLGLAQEWASFPVLSAMKGAHRSVARGQSYYAGDGLNKALVSADEVEDALVSVRNGFGSAVSAPTAGGVEAAEVKMVPAPAPAAAAPWWRRLLPGSPQPAPVLRPGLKPNGDPALWDVQSKLKRFGYEPILLDGLNGTRTRDAIRAARARNDLTPGDTVDAEFTAALPGLLPAEVSDTRAFAPDTEIKARSPDLFAPFKGLQGFGGIVGGMSALGAASDAGVMDQIKTTIDNVTSTTSSIQSGLQTLFGIGQWLYSHWWIIGLVAGIWIALKGYIGWLHLKALWRAGRAT